MFACASEQEDYNAKVPRNSNLIPGISNLLGIKVTEQEV